MMIKRLIALAGALIAGSVPALAVTDPRVERVDSGHVTVSWTDPDSVAVFVATDPSTGVAGMTPVTTAVQTVTLPADTAARRYFLLRARNGQVTRVAERVLPLSQASNFRDIGGYPTAGGKHVRWGMIYRSGGTPLLSDADRAEIASLGLKDMIDLRSNEERGLAPSRIEGVRYSAYGYSLMSMMKTPPAQSTGPSTDIYRNFPTFLAPELRIVFAKLLGHEGPLAYNCSAGQDRTGFTTAIILAALGTPRATIYQDYLLSTQYRRPEFEMPRIDEATAKSNPAGAMFAALQRNPEAARPKPLVDAQGKPLLAAAFDEIERRWGSVDAYLAKEVGVNRRDLAQLRVTYLE